MKRGKHKTTRKAKLKYVPCGGAARCDFIMQTLASDCLSSQGCVTLDKTRSLSGL